MLNLDELSFRQVQTTFLHLEALWVFLSSARCFEQKGKILAKALICESLKLFRIILFSTSANDNEEHQIRLIQCLRLFHQLVKVLKCLFIIVNGFYVQFILVSFLLNDAFVLV